MSDIQQEEQIVEQAESTLMSTISEIVSSFLQIAQQNIVERIQNTVSETLEQAKQTVNQIVQNAVMLFAIILLGLIGFVFAITGLSLWLGELSGFGAWFGFLIIGTIVFIIALIAGLLQKNKQI
ncbi:MAG: phage holin family protein [Candidatus Moraniibacteriota bacterium]|jgi:hypothetical protein